MRGPWAIPNDPRIAEAEADLLAPSPGASDERCPICGCAYADDNETTHECPPGFA